ncbi:MAG: DedA family protein [Candidatus Parcubacteria bacterium]|nr:DedA family protein [Candidatus Parcubacteria bacterium]
MILPPELANYIIKYGYWAVFSLIFAQELGVPNPVPNEVILLFAGYLASTGALKFYLIFLFAVAADIIGTTVLYSVFYFFGDQIIKHAPKWLPISKIEKIKQKVAEKGSWGILAGRMIPYLRGYASVAAGLLKIPPRKFLVAVVVPAIVWSGGYVTAGRLIGKGWQKLASNLSPVRLIIVVVIVLFLIFYVIPKVLKYIRRKKDNPKQ